MKKTEKKRDSVASKQLILDNAKLLFSKKGFKAASMENLSEMTGLNKAMIFYYFKNKKGLYEAVMTEILSEIYEVIAKNSKRYSHPQEKLESFIRTFSQYATTHPYFPALLLNELSSSGAMIPEQLFFAMRQLFSLFSSILKEGEKEGIFTDIMPMVIYFMILGTLNLMITTEPIRQEAQKLEEFDLDTCSDCEMDEITEYIIKKINKMLTP